MGHKESEADLKGEPDVADYLNVVKYVVRLHGGAFQRPADAVRLTAGPGRPGDTGGVKVSTAFGLVRGLSLPETVALADVTRCWWKIQGDLEGPVEEVGNSHCGRSLQAEGDY